MRFISVVFLTLVAQQASAFAPQQFRKSTSSTTRLFGQTKQPPEIPAPTEVSYGEESRKYRRTVFSHDDWVKFRSPDRFIRNLQSMVSSGVYKNLGREVGATVAVATFVCVWNALTGGYQDLTGTSHEALLPALSTLTLPLTPFTLSTSSLGLLLGM